MKKTAFLLIVGLLCFAASSPLQAQIFNGSFLTGDFTNWQTLGDPTVIDDPSSGGTQAVVSSTSGEVTTLVHSVSVATIDATLGVTLPQSYGTPPTNGATAGYFDPTNGQAIYQTFSMAAAGTLTFSYAFSTEDYAPYDSAGYVLDGRYTSLVTLAPFVSNDPTPKNSFTQASVSLGAGTHTLAFVSYNTNDHYASTSLYVTNITEVVPTPEPSTWAMLIAGGVGLFLVSKFRRSKRS